MDWACPHGKKRESMQDFDGARKMQITLKLIFIGPCIIVLTEE